MIKLYAIYKELNQIHQHKLKKMMEKYIWARYIAWSPSSLGGWDRKIVWAQEFETSLGSIVKSCLKKIKMIAYENVNEKPKSSSFFNYKQSTFKKT
jgi:hypothetical protein